MTERRSFYLDSKQNDFAEFSEIDDPITQLLAKRII
jgi:hypothetical protein